MIEDAKKRIKDAITDLNKEVDEMACQVRDLEKWLEEEHVGVKTRFEIPDSDLVLTYEKDSKRYRIGVLEETSNTWKPWTEWGRPYKIESYNWLPNLLIEIAKNVESLANRSNKRAGG